jgi:hypothetical protein
MGSEKALRCILIIGVFYLFVLFAGGVWWKQGPAKPIPPNTLQPFFRVTYGIPCREQQITDVGWSGGETKIDRDNPNIVWFKPKNSDIWTKSTTEELTVQLIKQSIENRSRIAKK